MKNIANKIHGALTIVVGIFVGLFLSVSMSQAQTEQTRVRWIDVHRLNKVVEEQNPVIVDLRTPGEFERGHIPGALNIPIEVFRADRSVLDAYKDKPVLLYCRTVNKTELVLWFLEGRGFKSVYALKGGYEAYRLRSR